MDPRMEQEISNAVFGAECLSTGREWFQSGVNASMFVRAVTAGDGFTFDQAVELYAAHVEAMFAGNHCHGEGGGGMTLTEVLLILITIFTGISALRPVLIR